MLQLSANEQKWLARIILQDMKIGLREEQILGFYHEQAMELWDATCDLRYVCGSLCDTGRHIDREATHIRLHRPFTPMLAAQLHHQLHKVEPAMRGHPFAVEMKIDGERMLCHKDGNQVQWFTRSATDYTEKYGPILTPRILRHVKVDKCILDGEVVGWDSAHETFLHFKENRSIVTDGGDMDGTRTLVYVVFDIVYLADPRAPELLEACSAGLADVDPSVAQGAGVKPGPITTLPLGARRDLLEAVVEPEPKKLELVRHTRIESTDPEQRVEKLMDAFEEALQDMEEGLMVKDLSSAYLLGEKARGLQQWCKMKPEFSDQTTNLDVIVLGAYYSEGKRRSGRIASLLVGVAEPRTSVDASAGKGSNGEQERKEQALAAPVPKTMDYESDEDDDLITPPWVKKAEPPAPQLPPSATMQQLQINDSAALAPKSFYTLARVGGGLTYADWDELEAKLPLQPWQGGLRLPSHFKPWKPARRDIPDFLVDPKKSIILELKCAEINESTEFSSGYTLRFPRVEAIRYDKPWSQCLTVTELREIYENPVRKPTAEARLAFTSSSSTTVQVPALPMSPSLSSPSLFPPPGIAASSHRDRKSPLPVRIVDTYRTVDPSTVPVERNLLKGTEVCVIGDFALLTQSSDEESDSAGSGSDTNGEGGLSVASNSSADDRRVLSKAEVEKLVLANGGTLSSSPRQGETALVLAPDAKSLRVKLLIKAGKFDVVGLPFLLRCIRQGRLTPPRFGEYLYMTQATRDKITESVDPFGDPYVEPTTVKALARCFRQMKTTFPTAGSRGPPAGSALLAQLLHHDNDPDVRAIFDKMPLALFGGCTIYLDCFADLGPTTQDGDESSRDQRPREPLSVTRLDHLKPAIWLHGGHVSESLHVGVTHVVVDRRDTERFSLLAARLKQLRRLPVRQVEKRVVGSEWVEACLEAGTLVVPSSEHTVRLRYTCH